MNKAWIRRTAPLALAAAVAVTALAGCGKSKTNASSGSSPSASAAATPTKDDTAAALVPAKIRTAGAITVATDASYAPNEFKDSSGAIVGMDVDLGNAIGQVLGLKMTFTNTSFDGIIAALGSRFDIGMSSFTDNKDREKVVDMVTYFSAGTSFVVKSGSSLTINTLDDLCGHTAAAEKGTTQEDDIKTQITKCSKAGKAALKIQTYPDENGAVLALTSGRADVLLADSPVNAYAVKQSSGALAVTGASYGQAPYGIAIPKAAEYKGLSDAILAALKDLISDGTYTQILNKWGIAAGAITTPVINGAVS